MHTVAVSGCSVMNFRHPHNIELARNMSEPLTSLEQSLLYLFAAKGRSPANPRRNSRPLRV